ncbi:MAG: methyltransferase domain-containing protein [Luteolibacter sp.]
MSNSYESAKILDEYLLFHYASDDEILPHGDSWPSAMRDALGFTRRTVSHFSKEIVASGLDIGCAVGGSTFEMSRSCQKVTGIDFSQSFINAAEQLRRGETLTYHRLEEAGITTKLVAHATPGIDTERIRFQHGDAMNLPLSLGSFDRVHAANLVCRLPEPHRFLDRLPPLINQGGELVLATPCTWLAEFTPPQNWPTTSTFDWLRKTLSPDFDLQHQCEEPFLIRETARKFQWSRALVTVWRRK